MKCIKCSYPLWNLREPRCPECSEAFDVRDWRYSAKHVAFLCPQCQQKLGPYKPGPIDKNCPGCDHLIDWGSVTVVPLIDDESQIARRKSIKPKPPAFSFGTLIAAAILGSGGFCYFGAPLAGRPEPPVLLLYVVGFTYGLGVAWIGVRAADRRHRAMNVMAWGLIVAMWFTYLTSRYVQERRAYYWFDWRGHTTMRLMNLRKVFEIYWQENGTPSSLKLLVVDEYVTPDSIISFQSSTTPEDIRIGRWSVQDWFDGDVSANVLRRILATHPAETEWERIGDFVFSRSITAHQTGDSRLIVGLSPARELDGARYAILADGSTYLFSGSRDWIKVQDNLRASLGLETLPELP